MTAKIEDLAEARRKQADAKGEYVQDFAFLAYWIAEVARNLAAYSHVASEKPGALTLSKRKLAELMDEDFTLLTKYIRELKHKAAEEEPFAGKAS
jgi:hypothetical protein